MASKRAKRNFKRANLLPKFAMGGRIGSRVIPGAEEPWKRDAQGNLPSEWEHSASGSIIPDTPNPALSPMKIGTIEKDEEGNLSLMGVPPPAPVKPKQDPFSSNAMQSLRFAEGGFVKKHLSPAALADIASISHRVASGAGFSPLGYGASAALYAGEAGATTPLEKALSAESSRRQLAMHPDQVSRAYRNNATMPAIAPAPMPPRGGRFSGAGSTGRWNDTAPEAAPQVSPHFSTYQDLAQEMANEADSQRLGMRRGGRGMRRASADDAPPYELVQKLAGFADGGRIGLRGGPLLNEDPVPKMDYSKLDYGMPVSNSPYMSPQEQATDQRLKAVPPDWQSDPKLPYTLGSPINTPLDRQPNSRVLAEYPAHPVTRAGFTRPPLERITDITSLMPPRDPNAAPRKNEFTDADIGKVGPPSTAEQPVQIPSATGYTYPDKVRIPQESKPHYGSDRSGFKGEPGPTQSADTEHIRSLPVAPTSPAPTSLRESYSLRDRGEPTGPLAGPSAEDILAKINPPTSGIPEARPIRQALDLKATKAAVERERDRVLAEKRALLKKGYADGGQIWGGPETDNESTRIHSPIYKGLGGKWDGMPMFADGGSVPHGHVTKLKKGEGALLYADGDQVSRRPDFRRTEAAKGYSVVLPDSQIGEDNQRVVPMTAKDLETVDMAHLKRRYGYAGGGQINRKGLRGGVKDGVFYGKGGPTQDKVHIRASPGEFIVPADSARKIGMGKLRKMVAATHKPVHLAQGMADGEGVWDWIKRQGGRLAGRGKEVVQAAVEAARPASAAPEAFTPAGGGYGEAEYSPRQWGTLEELTPKPANTPPPPGTPPKIAADYNAPKGSGFLRTWGGPVVAGGLEALNAYSKAQQPGAIPGEEYTRGGLRFGAGMAGAKLMSEAVRPLAGAALSIPGYGMAANRALTFGAPIVGYAGGSLGLNELFESAGDRVAQKRGPNDPAPVQFDSEGLPIVSPELREANKGLTAAAPGAKNAPGYSFPKMYLIGTQCFVPRD